jgi:ribosomal 50S subunit-recycling heat shock protein
MRIDDYLSTVGVIKRRTIAKQLCQNGMVTVGGRAVKAACQVKVGDIIVIKGSRPLSGELLDIPSGSVSKDQRGNYFKVLTAGSPA